MDDGLERRQFKPGQPVFTQGDEGDEAFIIEDGEIEIATVKGNAELVVGMVAAGELLGEMALLDASPRMATARARKPSTVIVIPKRVFNHILKESNPVLKTVMMTLMRRLRGEVKASGDKTL